MLHKRITEGYFGIPAFNIDGVVHEAVPPFFDLLKFHRRFRLNPDLFAKLYHNITDPATVVTHGVCHLDRSLTMGFQVFNTHQTQYITPLTMSIAQVK